MRKFFNYLINLIIFSFFFIGFFSCTQNVPDIKYGTATVIFDYKNNEELPQARLSIFVESNSDVKRYERINVKSAENGYIWDVSEILKIKKSDKMYAGNTNLVVPSGEKFPTGEYSIIYENADLEQVQTKIYLNYDTAFYNTKALEIPDLMKRKFGKKNIAIYDKNSNLIYYGERTDLLRDTRKIWNKYRNASFFTEVWCLSNNSVMCIMPIESVTPSQE